MKLVSLALVLLLIQTSEYPPDIPPNQYAIQEINIDQNLMANTSSSNTFDCFDTSLYYGQKLPIAGWDENGIDCACQASWCNQGYFEACKHLSHNHCPDLVSTPEIKKCSKWLEKCLKSGSNPNNKNCKKYEDKCDGVITGLYIGLELQLFISLLALFLFHVLQLQNKQKS